MKVTAPTALALLAALAACATSGKTEKSETVDKTPSACERGLCAKIVERELSNEIVVEVTAPAGAQLHNAWVAEPGVAPCRGGRALNAVGSDAGVALHGPRPLAGTERLSLSFALRFTSGTALDLDVRGPGGAICLRVPFEPTSEPSSKPSSTADGGAEGG